MQKRSFLPGRQFRVFLSEPIDDVVTQLDSEFPEFFRFGGADATCGIVLQPVALAAAGIEIVCVILPVFPQNNRE